MSNSIENNSSLNLLIQQEIKNKQNELVVFEQLLKDIDNVSFCELWVCLLRNNCKDITIFENLAYNLFKNLDELIINKDKKNTLNCLVIEVFNILIYLPVEWPINWRKDIEKKLDIYIELNSYILQYPEYIKKLKMEINRYNTLFSDDSLISENPFNLKEYVELLKK